MTPKELKRLSRSDLLEMLLELSKENDQLRKENAQMRRQLEDRNIAIANSGSLAEAALTLNGVFQAAQAACEQYTQNIQYRSEHIEQHCRQMEQETKAKCDAMLAEAKSQALAYLAEAKRRRSEQDSTYGWLTELMDSSEAT